MQTLGQDTAGRRLRWKTGCRRLVKATGKNLRLALVPDTPIISNRFSDRSLKAGEASNRKRVTLRHREDIPAFHEISPGQKRISTRKNWRTIILFGFGTNLATLSS